MSEIIVARILKRVVINDETGCWEWVGFKDKDGYGRVSYGKTSGGYQRMALVHRVMYALKIGEIPEGLCVCHHCDNPSCCNPEHLWLGTNEENTADRYRKGRTASGLRNGMSTRPETILRGSAAAPAKLTEANVVEIRKAWSELPSYRTGKKKEFIQRLAEEHAVSKGAIVKVFYRRKWKHI